MKIVVSGSSGLVGTALVAALGDGGHDVLRLVRRPSEEPGTGLWDPERGTLDVDALAGCDAAVHLSGESIAAGRWTEKRKSRILTSRTKSTRLLAESLAALETPPRALVTASAIGWYGNRSDELLDEDAQPGEGFLADVCVRWEAAAEAVRTLGIRHVALRIGMVLTPRGGALAQMLTPFRLGLGGVVGSGRQWVSWITLDDLVGVILHALHSDFSGPVNAVSPHPVTMRDFTKALGRALRRPTVLPLPAFVVRTVFGEMGEGLLLSGARVDAGRLVDSGYTFRHPDIDGALESLLK